MKINEIFKSISGEAANAGYPTTFIRTYGCNLRCTYCDSMYAVEGGDYTVMNPNQILKKCDELGVKRIVLTGGEPLMQPDTPTLVDKLCDAGYGVEIETNGAVNLSDFHERLTTVNKLFLSYTMDMKSLSSGMAHRMISKNLEFLGPNDVVKFVVGTILDLQQMKEVINAYNIQAQVFVSPIFGAITPQQIVDYVLENNLNDVRTQIQLHKVIWDKDKRGV